MVTTAMYICYCLGIWPLDFSELELGLLGLALVLVVQ